MNSELVEIRHRLEDDDALRLIHVEEGLSLDSRARDWFDSSVKTRLIPSHKEKLDVYCVKRQLAGERVVDKVCSANFAMREDGRFTNIDPINFCFVGSTVQYIAIRRIGARSGKVWVDLNLPNATSVVWLPPGSVNVQF